MYSYIWPSVFTADDTDNKTIHPFYLTVNLNVSYLFIRKWKQKTKKNVNVQEEMLVLFDRDTVMYSFLYMFCFIVIYKI